MEKWKEQIRSFQKLSVKEREKDSQLIVARKMMKQEKDFKNRAISFLCCFLPENYPDISKRRKTMLNTKIDLTEFMVNLIENFPPVFSRMQSNI